MSEPITIGLIFGGASNEHVPSTLTAKGILEGIDTERYKVVLIGIDLQGGWHRVDSVDDLETAGPGGVPDSFEDIDVAFPLLHGKFGEDGTVQGYLELLGIPYVGCGVLASAAGMDKQISQQLFAAAGIPTIPTFTVTEANRAEAAAAAAEYGYPVFVKPNRSGTSVGASPVAGPEDLDAALDLALEHDDSALLQPRLTFEEINIGVLQLEDGSLLTSPANRVHISPDVPFYDYTTKYTKGLSSYEIPAAIPADLAARLDEYARLAFTALGGEGFARVDFFVGPDGQIIINEINTIPGLTEFSQFPVMFKALGMGYAELVEIFLRRALKARPARTPHTLRRPAR